MKKSMAGRTRSAMSGAESAGNIGSLVRLNDEDVAVNQISTPGEFSIADGVAMHTRSAAAQACGGAVPGASRLASARAALVSRGGTLEDRRFTAVVAVDFCGVPDSGLVELGAPLLLLASNSLSDPGLSRSCALAGWGTLTAMHVSSGGGAP